MFICPKCGQSYDTTAHSCPPKQFTTPSFPLGDNVNPVVFPPQASLGPFGAVQHELKDMDKLIASMDRLSAALEKVGESEKLMGLVERISKAVEKIHGALDWFMTVKERNS